MIIEFTLILIGSLLLIILIFKLINMYTTKKLSKKYPIGSELNKSSIPISNLK
jgi:hypothetical protein